MQQAIRVRKEGADALFEGSGNLRFISRAQRKIQHTEGPLVVGPEGIVAVQDKDRISRGVERCPLERIRLPELGSPLLHQRFKVIFVVNEFPLGLLLPVDGTNDGAEEYGSQTADDDKRERVEDPGAVGRGTRGGL